MKRRQLLAALGAVGAGGAVVTGTGAFSSTSAARDVSVQVATDATGYLSLSATGPNAPYVDASNGQFGLDLTGDNETGAGGGGVNLDAITVFEDLFEIRNQGTQAVEVEATPLTFIDTGGAETLVALVVPASDFPTVTLAAGSAEAYSLVVDVFPDGDDDLEIDDTITITGEATS